MYQGNQQGAFSNTFQQNRFPNNGFRIMHMNSPIQPIHRGPPMQNHQTLNSSARFSEDVQSPFVKAHNNYRPNTPLQNLGQQRENVASGHHQFITNPASRHITNNARMNQPSNNQNFSGHNSHQNNLNASNAFNNSPTTTTINPRNIYHGQNQTDSVKSSALTSHTGLMPTPKPRMFPPRNVNTEISGLIPLGGSYSNRSLQTQNVSQTSSSMLSGGARKKFRKFGDRDNEKLCVLTGSVERVIKYGKIFQNHFCYYQVFGSVVAITDGSIRFEKKMLLRDRRGGPVLQLTYYCNSTHINIVDFYIGQDLRAVGRMIGPNNMSALSIRAARQEELDNLLRMSYISDYAVHYYCGEKQTSKTERI